MQSQRRPVVFSDVIITPRDPHLREEASKDHQEEDRGVLFMRWSRGHDVAVGHVSGRLSGQQSDRIGREEAG